MINQFRILAHTLGFSLELDARVLLMKSGRIAAIGSLGVGLVYLITSKVYLAPRALFIVPLLLITICSVSRITLINYYLKQSIKTASPYYAYLCFTLLSGFAWGTLGFGGLGFSEVGLHHQLITMVVLAGVSQSSISSLATSRGLCSTFLTLTLLPMTTMSILRASSNEAYIGSGILFLLYWLYLLSQCAQQNRFLMGLLASRKELARERNLLKTTLDAFPGPVSFIDKDLNYRLVNQALSKLLSIPENQIIGKKLGFLHSSGQWRTVVENFVNGSEENSRLEVNLEDANHKLRCHSVSLRKSNQDPVGAVIVGLDIQSEKDAAQKSFRSAKMAALGEMAAGIAHEINNPLSIVTGKIRLVRRDLAAENIKSEKILENLNRIEVHSDRIARIVRGLKSFSRNGEQDPILNTPLAVIFQDAFEIFSERLRTQKIDFRIKGSTDIHIPCRATQIIQVLINLVGNAIDAVLLLENRWIEVEVNRTDSHALISVTDSGKGIPADIISKLMEPFFTTKTVGKGTGLGLSISKDIIESHGGSLKLNTSFSNTRFEIEIPFRLTNHSPSSDSTKSAA